MLLKIRRGGRLGVCLMLVLLTPIFYAGPSILAAWIFCPDNPAARGYFLKSAGWASILQVALFTMMAITVYGMILPPLLALKLIAIFFIALERMKKYLDLGAKELRHPLETPHASPATDVAKRWYQRKCD